ncbi:MAG TPA: translocation/assembly module TamB domain-containing protein [Chthoniobacteraceae bacterium]|nr:translocation/assembly module TamB domain-containing protein [Chthoniobacteraceae bacterium]
MTSGKSPEKPKTKPKRKWLKRFCWGFAGLLLVLALFHQPILMALLRFSIARVAAGQHVAFQYDVEGRALSGLVFKNVRITANGRTPIDKITIDEVRADYSVLDLLWHGRAGFLKHLEVKNASLAFKDVSDAESFKPGHSPLGTDMHGWFFPPAELLGSADIENLNIINRSPDGDFVLQSGEIHFQRGKTGTLKIERMQIPRLRDWNHIEGSIVVTGTDFTIEDLKIAPDVVVRKLVSTPASTSKGNSLLTLKASIFGGDLSADYSDKPGGPTFDADVHVSATKFGFDGLGKFLKAPISFAGEFDHLDLQCSGMPGTPSSWTGTSTASIAAFAQVGPVKFDQGNAKLVLKDGNMALDASFARGQDKVTSAMQGQMPQHLKGFPAMALDGRFQVAVPDLSQSIDAFTNGGVVANGEIHLRDRVFQTDFIATGSDINSERFDASAIQLKASFSKGLDSGFPGDASGKFAVDFKDARVDKYALDSGAVTAEGKNGWLKLDATGLRRAENTASFSGNFQLPADFSKVTVPDFDLNFAVHAPNAAAFNAEPNLNGVNGEFETSGTLAHHNNSYDGKIAVTGSKLLCGDFKAESMNASITIERNVAKVPDFALVVDSKNRLAGSGSAGLGAPYAYDGTLQANISDLTMFRAFFDTLGLHQPVAGALTADWSGNGDIQGMHHSGQGSLKLTGGRYGNYLPITAEIAGKYSPEAIDVPTLHVHVDKTDFVATVGLHDKEFQVRDILLQQGKIRLLMGEIMFPVDLRTPTDPATLVPHDGRVFANLSSDEINLETLLLQPKQTSPFRGFLKLSVNADGPLDNLPADILLRVRNLQVKATPSVAPGNLELDASLMNNQLALDGAFRQPAISPLQIKGQIPFSLVRLLKEHKLDEKSPIALSLTLDKSPVTIFGQIEPRIRYIEGQMGIDARATGTIAKPELSGAVTLDLPAIRLRDPAAPAVNHFVGNLEFTGNQLVIHQFGGEISGGPFNLTGRMLFEKLTTPTLDLRLTSQNALLVRNETLTIRADSDLKISGVANAANVTGTIGLTKSRFFRDVEILPISLPGKPAPKPPTEMTGFSLKPPFAKWTFNVGIKTEDPFLVRGNLANGAAHLDLKLVGTGAAPALDGMASIDNFVASLPFSRLNIEYGYAYFSPDNPFMPTLDIQGTSSLRDYNIRVYISGTPTDPVTVLTSDPPLPQEEIVALLGTGATSQELTSNSDVLAGRAAVLLAQDLYRKIFRQKPRENQSFLTRFELNPGAVDPRTGRQEVNARFKMTEQFYVTGDIDDQGGVRGQVGYLIRFR